MRKTWIALAFLFIIIGAVGVVAYDFKLDQEKPAYSKTWTLEPAELTDLSYDSETAIHVQFVPSTDALSSITLSGKMRQENIDLLQTFSPKAGKLDIHLLKEPSRFLNLSFRTDKQEMIVKLSSKDALKVFSLNLHSGSIKVKGARAEEISLITGSGSVTIAQLTANKAIFHSGSGSITATDVVAETAIDAGSGRVSLKNLAGPSHVSVGSGSVRFVQAAESGDSVNIETGSGSITFTSGAAFKGHYDLKSDSGSVHSPDTVPKSSAIVKIRSGSGSIKVKQ
ncbi:MAG: DUF4097 domain-containing protein [Alicyclobacillus macrosporangiidus]|uniref:DUF4097 family beta strand repeat-containing protein n=1 Tax=Alicyclobacillus macrosporangiidus TaxID=392015 RepID=UPI0026ED1423|nr:DUF4097 family beta strand repeat-containing protein [Alicyclobacillus macrosporangiidus]MCL6599707.1 DUF4097 domain-containing protein [Alicyclobacillus macrosporangiidus]